MVLASWTNIILPSLCLFGEATHAFQLLHPLRSPRLVNGQGQKSYRSSSLYSVYNQTGLASPAELTATPRRRRISVPKKDVAKDLFLQHLPEYLALSELFEKQQNAQDLWHRDSDGLSILAAPKATAKATANELFEVTIRDTTASNELVHDASSVVRSSKIEAPSVMRILKFAIPAIGVYLCDPILSLIDTSAVGMLAGTIPQAALTPACAVTDYAALLVAFLFTATTNLVAAAKASDRGVKGSPNMTRSLVGSLQLSTYVGGVLGLILFVFARPLVQAIVGTASGVSPAVIDSACIYVRIRALGMPAAAQIGSAQAACLGMQDIPSQFIVLAAAALVNLVTDMALVGHSNPWIGGAAGAAWATIFSQYTAVAVFCRWISTKPKTTQQSKSAVSLSSFDVRGFFIKSFLKGSNSRDRAISSLNKRFSRTSNTKKASHVSIQEQKFSVRGLLKGNVPVRDLFKLPSRETLREFWPYFIPVTFAQLGRVSGFVAMSYVVASSMGTMAMAAQQIIASLVYCLFPVSDSLSLTGQAFVPSIAERTPSPERSAALRQIMVNLSKAAGIFGVITAGLVGFTPLVSGLLTSDPLVVGLVNGVVPMLAASFPIYALVMALEGFLLGQKDLGFQGKMYTSWLFVVPYFMLKVKEAVLGGAHHLGIQGVWAVLCAYQVIRLFSWSGRAFWLQRRTEQNHPVLAYLPV